MHVSDILRMILTEESGGWLSDRHGHVCLAECISVVFCDCDYWVGCNTTITRVLHYIGLNWLVSCVLIVYTPDNCSHKG